MSATEEPHTRPEPVSNADLARLARLLLDSERTRIPIEPLTSSFPGLSFEEAYQIQRININDRMNSGERLVGHKIGLTAQAMRDKFNVADPDYGHLLDTMISEENQPFELAELIDPQVEVEPAFFLGKPLRGPGITIDDVLEATDYIRVCFEIIDSRIIDWNILFQDTVADNGSSARVIFGPQRILPTDFELDDLETGLELDGKTVETGSTSAILGHPANGIAWLANTMAEFDTTLEAGHVVLPGTAIRCHRMAGHKVIRGWIEKLGEVTIKTRGQPTVTY